MISNNVIGHKVIVMLGNNFAAPGSWHNKHLQSTVNGPTDICSDREIAAQSGLLGETIFPLMIKSKNKSKDKHR